MSQELASFIILLISAWACMALARIKKRNIYIASVIGVLFGILGVLFYIVLLLFPPRDPPFIDPVKKWLDRKFGVNIPPRPDQ